MFDFIEDQRSNPVLLESYVSTGYLSGVITINAMEADNARREETRELLNESYRTLLGHLRHESGHYYYGFLNDDPVQRASFVELFGDPSQDYQRALEKHYSDGPTPDWQQSYISSYASSHPLEDWAERWSHYLHMTDTLETAMNYNIVKGDLYLADFAETTGQWKEFAVALNELNRSMGLADAYPFVINAEVERKLAFVGQTISWLRQNFPTAATH